MRVAFGQFVVDTQVERLWKGGVEVRLREQPLQILLVLLRHHGEVVSRDTLRQQLWGNSTYVDFDNGLNTAISRLREVLEDDPANPSWIERVPKRGYRFIGSLPRPEAVAAYIKGHHVISPHSPENMRKSLAFFREAMALDPSYPLAYHGAALVSILRCLQDDLRPREALVEADAYLQEGLRCPQQTGMVYNTLALLRTFERRWDEADEASRKAVELEPENPNVRMIRAQLLSCLGQHDEAIREARLAVDLDPIHLRSHMHLTKVLCHARMWEACVHAGKSGLEVCPDPYIGIYASQALIEMGKPQEALELNLQTRRAGNLLAAEVAYNAYIAARAGTPSEAVSALQYLEQSRGHRYVPAITLCWLELALGHDDSAMNWLLTARAEGEPYLAFIDVDPMYGRLRTRLANFEGFKAAGV
jgi:DNA-binding winged helix-turn-helix (wHTH) protein